MTGRPRPARDTWIFVPAASLVESVQFTPAIRFLPMTGMVATALRRVKLPEPLCDRRAVVRGNKLIVTITAACMAFAAVRAHAEPAAVEEICRTLAQAAADNELPEEFFTRLIWQESRFDPKAVSPKGAQGIAQFMPQTAAMRGLADAFEPLQALRESTSYLRELRTTFRGNIGLAAAAYNAGPAQVEAWLAGRSLLPFETQAYVRIVTGYAAEAWTSKPPPQFEASKAPAGERCAEIAK